MSTKLIADAEGVTLFADEFQDTGTADPTGGQMPDGVSSPSGLDVRSYRLLDSSAIGKLPYRYELHHPESDGDRPHTASLFSRRLFAGENSNRPLFVASVAGRNQHIGALQCLKYGADGRWYLQYLTAIEPVLHDSPAPIALIEHAISEAGWCGARRIMARSESGSELTTLLRNVGFSAFGHEIVFVATESPGGEPNREVRTQLSSDVWSIHQLYLQTTPRDVQNAEALTSHEWDVELEGRSVRGWFMTTAGTTTAFLRVRTSRRYHRLDAMFVPGSGSQMGTLFDHVFAILQNESPRPIYVGMRGYQQELESVLVRAELLAEVDQMMMVRYTTASVPVRPNDGFEMLRTAEADPRRVPSFYVRDAHE